MSDRTRLPNRRGTETMEFRVGMHAIPYTVSIGRFDDGRLAEVFLTSGRAGTDVSIQAQESAIMLSLALQHGVPAETIRTALPRAADGKPEGAIGVLLDILAMDKS